MTMLEHHKQRARAVLPVLLVALPLLASLTLLLPACVQGHVFYYNAGGVIYSIGGTGFYIDHKGSL